jgi:hypothetical protein
MAGGFNQAHVNLHRYRIIWCFKLYLSISAGKLQKYKFISWSNPMSKKQHNIKLEYKPGVIDINKIDPSPFQCRKFSDEVKSKELAGSIDRDGLIEPIVVRRKDDGRYEIIAGHRRVQAVRDYTDWKTIPAQIIKVDDLQAQHISAAENLQREDLSAIETIEGIVKIVDGELIQDKEYAAMGKNPAERVKTLLGKLKAVRRSKERGYNPSKELKHTTNTYVRRVEKIFKNLSKPLEWLSFLHHDLPLVIDFCKDVQEASMQNGLNGAQTRALAKLKAASNPEFQRLTARDKRPPKSEMGHAGNGGRSA